jgi:Acetyltransferase (GNAT) domain
MDYHRDRFVDHSLLVRGPEGDIVALLPAHAAGERISSHSGLSFGGLVVGPGMKAPLFLRCFEALLLELTRLDFAVLDYKTVPHIYNRHPAEEDRYALFLLGAELTRRDLLAVVTRDNRLPYQTRRARGVKKAQAAGVTMQEEGEFSDYWRLLAATLAERFRAEPVHTLDEIRLLRDRFPANIRLFTARSIAGDLLAGVVVYESGRVAHAQYIAASPAGREVAALDLLFDHLLNDLYRDIPYFDFGASHEEAGRAINVGLIDQKEGFGARAVAHDHYRIDLTAVRPGVLTEALR